MAPKKKAPNKAQSVAGKRNIIAFNQSREGKPAKTHGIDSFTGGAPLPDALLTVLEDWKRDLLSDLGNSPTAAEVALVDSACVARGVMLLAHRWMAEHGVIDKRGRPARVLRVLATYLNSMRLTLVTLGIERKVKRVNDLEAIALEYEKAAVAPVPGATEATP